MKLTTEEKYRYSRQVLLSEVGEEGQLKLKESKVLVVGAGGLGCPVLMYLVALGVGNLGIVDFDKVEHSNLQRQVLFSDADVNRSKAIVAKEKLEVQNPCVNIEAFNQKLTNDNAIDLFNQYDIIVDGTDDFSTRYLINDASILTGKPLVYGAIHKFEGQVSVFNYNEGPSYRCLFPTPPKANSIPTCSEIGVIGVLPGLIGMQQANEVVKIILNIGNVLSGRLMVYNALQASFFELKINRSVDLAEFGIENTTDFEAFDYDFFCGVSRKVESTILREKFDSLPKDTFVLDVRESWEEPKVENKEVLNIPLQDLSSLHSSIPKNKVVYVVCQKGIRSQAAITFLSEEYGFDNLVNVTGGLK